MSAVPSQLTRITSSFMGDLHKVDVYARKPGWTLGVWVMVLYTDDKTDAEQQAARWQARLEHDPFAPVRWETDKNRIEDIGTC